MKAKDIEALELKLIVSAIHERYGYDLRNYSPSFVKRRLMNALSKSGCTYLSELQHKIIHDPVYFLEMIEDMTIGVTEMFRDPEFFETFRTKVVPLLRPYPLLKIWHGGCASGEEVYACTIILKEEDVYDRCQVYATDMSLRALDHAKHGVYPASSIEQIDARYVRSGGTGRFSDYYTEAYGGIAMSEALRRNVLFFQHNLVTDHVFGEMHVIFCRNVLIYFDKDLKERVVAKFAASLRPNGILCLGASERLTARERALGFRELMPEARIYRYEPDTAEVLS